MDALDKQMDTKAAGFVEYEVPIFVEPETGRRFIQSEEDGSKIYEGETYWREIVKP